ncbi:Protein costars [Diplonema papillatum]|nr:Protein costars [Diplonema papillatum]
MANHQATVDRECEEMKKDIKRLGTQQKDGKWMVKFGPLFDDDKTQNYYEAIVGTLKAAKKKGILTFEGQMLLKGSHDDVEITLLKED